VLLEDNVHEPAHLGTVQLRASRSPAECAREARGREKVDEAGPGRWPPWHPRPCTPERRRDPPSGRPPRRAPPRR
jgi:hypothetical protein